MSVVVLKVFSAVLIAVGIYAKAAKESDFWFLYMYKVIISAQFVGILLAILLLRVTAAVLGLLFSEKVNNSGTRTNFRPNPVLDKSYDFSCCGVDSYLDWSKNMHFNASDQNPSLEAYGVPFSCCIQLKNETVFNSMCGYETQKMKNSVVSRLIYTTGCLDEIVWWGKQNLLLINDLSVLQICMMSLAPVQLCQIRSVQQKKRKRNPLLQQKN
uniref:Zgc:113223 n=1 Tax=Cyprinus carpio carpio TaxID=630221 RepID=A0A8C1ESQ0_CYPCA